jgi:magnesium-transporting ATPase (P-type)
MIIIDSNLNDGMAYVETSSLDGEKSLKPKIANNNLKGFFKNKLNYPEEKIENCKIFYGMKIKGFCQCDCPNSDLHKLDGRINISLKISNKKSNYSNFSINNEINDLSFPINQRQMLLKGSILKNTNWIIGFVLYTGMNNKIILNSKKCQEQKCQL